MYAAHTGVLNSYATVVFSGKFSYILFYYDFYTARVIMEIQSATPEIVKRTSIVSLCDGL